MMKTIYIANRPSKSITIAVLLGLRMSAHLQAAKPESPLASPVVMVGDVAAGPNRFDVDAAALAGGELTPMIQRYRQQADRYIFLSGGASRMTEENRLKLIGLFEAFTILAREGMRFAVGDGGTQAGIMEAAGEARKASGMAFDILGISPAPEIEPGKTPVDPNHTDVIGVRNDPWLEEQTKNGWEPSWGYWGSETVAMYAIFREICEHRPSVTIVANGGGITLDEVKQNVVQGRRMIVVQGSGRVADAIVETLFGVEADPLPDEKQQQEYDNLKAKVDRAKLPKSLFTVFHLDDGPRELAALLTRLLSDVSAPSGPISAEVTDRVRSLATEYLEQKQREFERHERWMTFTLGKISIDASGRYAEVLVGYLIDEVDATQGRVTIDIDKGEVIASSYEYVEGSGR